MFDILDLTKRRKKEVFSGEFKIDIQSAPQYFEYKQQNYPSARFSEIINNLITTGRNVVIATSWRLDWQINSFVTLQNGRTYTITQIESECYNDETQRFLRESPNCEFILALTEKSTTARGIK
jgi:hypothetical protein